MPDTAPRVVPLQVTGASLHQLGEQRDLVLEQLLVPRQVVAEERVRLGERSAAENHFSAAVRQGVQRREALKDAHGIVGAQNGDRGAEEDPARPAGDRREDDLGRRNRKIGPMMLTDTERIEAEFVGQDGFFHDVAEHVRLRLAAIRPVRR